MARSCFWNVNCLLLLSLYSDYIQCPYCMRRFNETAASQHINFCKDQSSRWVFDPAQTAAKLASRAQVTHSPQVLALMPLHAWGKQVEFAGECKWPILRNVRIKRADHCHSSSWELASFETCFPANSIFGCCRRNISIKLLRMKTWICKWCFYNIVKFCLSKGVVISLNHPEKNGEPGLSQGNHVKEDLSTCHRSAA